MNRHRPVTDCALCGKPTPVRGSGFGRRDVVCLACTLTLTDPAPLADVVDLDTRRHRNPT